MTLSDCPSEHGLESPDLEKCAEVRQYCCHATLKAHLEKKLQQRVGLFILQSDYTLREARIDEQCFLPGCLSFFLVNA